MTTRGWNKDGSFSLSDDDLAELAYVPERLHDSIRRYVQHGLRPGSFLEAVICNDLFGALTKADIESHQGLLGICRFFHNNTPSACHGSFTKMAAWIKAHVDAREQFRREQDTNHAAHLEAEANGEPVA